ncbi:MAG: (Fe-S)-binding protein, partial [Desulfovibrionales bacterium]
GECAAAPGGRKIMHVVFLDNGRSALARDPVFSQVLRCVRCGACANVCPCYRMVGGHQYGHVYIGAVGLVLTYFYHGRDRAAGLIQNCVNCEACREVCAAGIDLPFLIREVQERIGTEGGHPGISRFMGMALKNRRLFHGLLRAAAKVQKPLVSQGFLRHLPMVFREQEFRAIPAIVDRPFRDRWPALRREVKNPRQRVALFGGCVQDFVYPEQLEAAVRTMARKGTDVEFPLGQTCCGLPARMMGEANTARDVALLNVAAIDPNEYDLIVTLCASCASHLKYTYPRLFAGHAESEARMRQFADKVVDYSSFLTEVLELGPEDFDPSGETVAYHYPCHQCRGMGVKRQPKELLRMAGFKYHPAAEEDVCCGLGGTFSLKFPQISAQILAKKLDNMAATGADLLLTECPGCVMQLRGGMKRRGEKMAVKHIAEAVAGVLNKECEPDHGP